MSAVSKWVAAGSSAAVLAGGLFLGAPAAVAAPGDAVCLQASSQFEAALSAAGITEASVALLEASSRAAAEAEAAYLALFEAAAAGPRAALDEATAGLAAASAAQDAAEDALEDALVSGDATAIEEAEIAKDAAETAEDAAEQAVLDLEAAYNAAISTQPILDAQGAMDTAVANFENALAAVSLDDATAAELSGLFDAFLAACNEDAVVVDPVVTSPGSTTPVVAKPVTAAPAGAGNAAGVVATNKGLNVQTAAAAEPGVHPGLALLAGLLTAGIAVPAVVALRMRRLERTRS
ncbi:hypothetical protein [Arthrobacter sp. ZGTC131]|uniref:hypothetical protein n=1 Tax=Arthrobacter sp. ZGTC131 TaxID=2058898 RepID=UPI000CE39DA5|nr:hypothetical protein [Arthrobacter sp. ZGTC131]